MLYLLAANLINHHFQRRLIAQTNKIAETKHVDVNRCKVEPHADKIKSSDAKPDNKFLFPCKVQPEDEAVAIAQFRSSFKPFIASSFVLIVMLFGAAGMFPAISRSLLAAATGVTLVATFRCHLLVSEDQGRARWLFGWSWVAVCAFLSVVSVIACPQGAKVPRLCVLVLATQSTVCWLFLNIAGMTSPCRMIVVFTNTINIFSLPIDWTVDDHATSSMTLLGGIILGEILGRIWVQQDGRVGAALATRNSQLSSKHFLAFCIACTFLEQAVCTSLPILASPSPLHMEVQLVMCAGAIFLQDHARRLFSVYL